MASERPCARCRNLFIPRGPGRPPKNCAVCRAELAPEPEGLPDTPFFAQLRREIAADS